VRWGKAVSGRKEGVEEGRLALGPSPAAGAAAPVHRPRAPPPPPAPAVAADAAAAARFRFRRGRRRGRRRGGEHAHHLLLVSCFGESAFLSHQALLLGGRPRDWRRRADFRGVLRRVALQPIPVPPPPPRPGRAGRAVQAGRAENAPRGGLRDGVGWGRGREDKGEGGRGGRGGRGRRVPCWAASGVCGKVSRLAMMAACARKKAGAREWRGGGGGCSDGPYTPYPPAPFPREPGRAPPRSRRVQEGRGGGKGGSCRLVRWPLRFPATPQLTGVAPRHGRGSRGVRRLPTPAFTAATGGPAGDARRRAGRPGRAGTRV
jgi:hypothetical protein